MNVPYAAETLAMEILPRLPTAAVILFIAGLVLLALEIFIPGFGVAGSIGFLCLVGGIILTAHSVTQALIMILILFAVFGIVLAIILHSASKGGLSKKLILKESGENSSVKSYDALVGKSGVTETVLRPAGIARIGESRIDVMTQGDFLPPGTPIEVVAAKGSSVIVKKIIP